MKFFISGLAMFLMAAGAAGCHTVKAFEKEYLLSPIMDDKGVSELGCDYSPKMFGKFERLSAGGAGAAGTSCPTCGG